VGGDHGLEAVPQPTRLHLPLPHVRISMALLSTRGAIPPARRWRAGNKRPPTTVIAPPPRAPGLPCVPGDEVEDTVRCLRGQDPVHGDDLGVSEGLGVAVVPWGTRGAFPLEGRIRQ